MKSETKKQSQIRNGVILSYINLLLGCLIPIIYTPIMLQLLGPEEHGLYALATSVTGYLGLLSFGFGGTIVRYIAKYRAENKIQEIEKIFGLFLKIYGFLSIVAVLAGTIIAINVDQFFSMKLSAQQQQDLSKLLILLSLTTALSLMTSVVISIITAFEDFTFQKLIDIFSTIAIPIANLAVLTMGQRSIGIVIVSVYFQIFILIIYWLRVTRKIRIHPTFGSVNRDLIKEIILFSFYIFLGSVVDSLFWSTDKLLLGALVGTTAVSVYQIGSTFNLMITQASSTISGLLTPRITMIANNGEEADQKTLSHLFIRVGRIQFFIVFCLVSGFTVFGKIFINLWAGTNYADSYWIAILTLYPLCIPLIQNTGISIMTAQNKHKFRSVTYLLVAVLNVIGTYFLIPVLGGIGAALCSCLSYILGQGIIMNIYYYRIIKLDILEFWKQIIQAAVFPVILMAIGLLVVNELRIINWGIFIIWVIVYFVIYCFGIWCFSMNSEERSMFIRLIRRIN